MRIVFFANSIWRRVLFLMLVLLLLPAGKFITQFLHPPLGGEEIVHRGLDNLQKAYSYAYKLTAVSLIDGKETLLTEVEGVWNAPDRYHIKGETLANPLEAFIIGDKYIIRDPQGGWIQFQGGQGPSLLRETVLFSESPLTDLRRLHSVEMTGERVVAGQRCYLVEGKLAVISNPLWQAFWQDFTCRIWIDKNEFRIRQLELNGSSIGSEDKLAVYLEIYDYDAKLMISPPETDIQ